MVARKMNQILAVEKTVKASREDGFTKVYQNLQKSELTLGHSRTYFPKAEDGERLPPDMKKVQVKVEESLLRVTELMTEVFNVTAIKDATNCVARADVVVRGETILKGVPATHLLWMEKKLLSFADLISKLPTLSQDTNWQLDVNQSLYRSDETESMKTKKVETFPIVAPATVQHPAQVIKVVEDVNVGTWKTTVLCGAITVDRKKQLMARIEEYQRAVKEAREEANQTSVVELATGVIVERIFAP